MDEGRVYIFTAQHNDNFEEPHTIEGEIVGGRFGSAVMCLGDIDYDGYGDIAVGAPYEEESGGAVYIFNGNRDGVSRKYSQRLVGSRFSPTMRGFGISISEPRDVNHDNHSDIAVGAYLSGEVVLLKSMPVVTINVTLISKTKLVRNIRSFTIGINMSYEGVYVPNSLQFVATLKIDQLHCRATYLRYKGNNNYRWSYTLFKKPAFSLIKSPEIHLKKNIQNMISPLEISVSLQLDNGKNKNSCTSCIVNKLRSKTEDTIKLPFVDNDEDTIYTSDLGITLSTSYPDNRYVIGSTKTIMLRIDAYNRGKPAYQTKVRIFIEVLTLASIPPECIEDSGVSGTLLICDIGDPLRTKKTLMLQLDMSVVRYDVREVELRANISTQSDEANWDDNSYALTIYFDLDIDIAIAGKAQENLYLYLRENEKKPRNNIRFQHFYEVQNFGVSRIEAVLTVKIPTLIWQHDIEGIRAYTLVDINNVIGRMNGYELYCNISQTRIPFVASKKIASMHNVANIANNDTCPKFRTKKNMPINVRPKNRPLYVNCTSSTVYCEKFNCKLRSFLSTLSVAKIQVKLDLKLGLNFVDDMMKDKDIIFYVTEGSVSITQSYNITQRACYKSDTILVTTTFGNTTFLDDRKFPPIVQRIAPWIPLSVFLGIVLLMLLISGLKKIGFFNRERIDLEAIWKADADLLTRIV